MNIQKERDQVKKEIPGKEIEKKKKDRETTKAKIEVIEDTAEEDLKEERTGAIVEAIVEEEQQDLPVQEDPKRNIIEEKEGREEARGWNPQEREDQVSLKIILQDRPQERIIGGMVKQ